MGVGSSDAVCLPGAGPQRRTLLPLRRRPPAPPQTGTGGQASCFPQTGACCQARKRLPESFFADGVHDRQCDERIGQKWQGPSGPSPSGLEQVRATSRASARPSSLSSRLGRSWDLGRMRHGSESGPSVCRRTATPLMVLYFRSERYQTLFLRHDAVIILGIWGRNTQRSATVNSSVTGYQVAVQRSVSRRARSGWACR